MVSVADTKGNSVLTDKLIPLYTFGTGFLSEKIEIKTGEFRLTKFLVINPTGAIVYATPMAGSPLAYLTKKPLPMTINIFPDKVTSVLPEVLVVGDQSPSQFGYATFGVQIINPLEFYTNCHLDNPLISAPIQMTTAKLTISDNSGWIYSFKLIAEANHLTIRGGSEKYTFLLKRKAMHLRDGIYRYPTSGSQKRKSAGFKDPCWHFNDSDSFPTTRTRWRERCNDIQS